MAEFPGPGVSLRDLRPGREYSMHPPPELHAAHSRSMIFGVDCPLSTEFDRVQKREREREQRGHEEG